MNFIDPNVSDMVTNRFKNYYNNTFDTELNQILVAVASMDEKSTHECDDILSMFNAHDRRLIESTRDNLGIQSIKKLIIDVMFANKKYYEFYLNKAQENSVISSLFCEKAWCDIHKSSLSFKNVSKDYLCIFAIRFMSELALIHIKKKYIRLQIKTFSLEHYNEKCGDLLCQISQMLGMVGSRSTERNSTKGIMAMREVLFQVLSDNLETHHQIETNKEKIVDNILSLYYKKHAPKYNLPAEALLRSIAIATAESVFNVKKCNANYVIAKGIIEPYYRNHFDQKTITAYLIEYMFTYTKKQIKKNKGEKLITLYEASLINFLYSNGASEGIEKTTRLVSKLVYETLKILKKNQLLGSYEENMAICNAFYDIARKSHGLNLPSLDELKNKAKMIIDNVNRNLKD